MGMKIDHSNPLVRNRGCSEEQPLPSGLHFPVWSPVSRWLWRAGIRALHTLQEWTTHVPFMFKSPLYTRGKPQWKGFRTFSSSSPHGKLLTNVPSHRCPAPLLLPCSGNHNVEWADLDLWVSPLANRLSGGVGYMGSCVSWLGFHRFLCVRNLFTEPAALEGADGNPPLAQIHFKMCNVC